MAQYPIGKFFNKGNCDRIERLLTDEGIDLNLPSAARDIKLVRIRRYFTNIGVDYTREYRTRDDAIDILRETIRQHKADQEAIANDDDHTFIDYDWSNYYDTPFKLPIKYDDNIDDLFHVKTQYEELTDSLWNELPDLKPEPKAFKPR